MPPKMPIPPTPKETPPDWMIEKIKEEEERRRRERERQQPSLPEYPPEDPREPPPGPQEPPQHGVETIEI